MEVEDVVVELIMEVDVVVEMAVVFEEMLDSLILIETVFLYSFWKIHAYLRKLFGLSRKTRKCVCILGEGGTSK